MECAQRMTNDLGRRAFMTISAAASVIAGTAGVNAKPAPVWTPVPIPNQAPARDAVAELPGTKLWYWDTGGFGRPVILMHAATHSAAGWGDSPPGVAKTRHRGIAYSRQ